MARKRYYSDDDPEVGVTPSQLKRLGRDRQRDYVLAWFARHYEDPAEETPYNGQEGGYQYIWGGPYDAREELWSEFEGVLSEERIDALADEIERDGTTDWAPGPAHPDHERAAAEHAADMDDQVDPERSGGRSFLLTESGDYITTEDGSRIELESATEAQEPDLGPVTRDLEQGLKPDFGSEDERRARAVLQERLAAMEAEIARLRPEHGGLGHNNPPPDEEASPLPAVLDEIATLGSVMTTAVDESEPDALTIARAATRLQALGRWLAGKGDKFADEFVKAFGKSLGTAAGVVVASGALLTLIMPVLQAAATWLHTVTWPF